MTATVWHENGSRGQIASIELRQAALSMLEARRAMRGHLPEHLVHDVALEMLLAIYLVGKVGIAIDCLFEPISVPSDLAARWLRAIASERLVSVEGIQVTLSERGDTAMTQMLTSVVQSQRRLNGWSDH